MPNEQEQQNGQGQMGEAAGAAAEEARREAGLKAALLKERRLRQELERKLAARLQPGGTPEADGNGTAPDLDALTKLEITEQDLDGEKLPALNAKIRQITSALVRLGGERQMAGRAAEVQAIVDKYGIFQDEEADLAADAQQALLAEVAEIEGPLDAAKLDAAAKTVAQRFSRYKAAAAGGSAGGGAGRLAPSAAAGGGGAGAAHVAAPGTFKTVDEMKAKTRELAAKFCQRMGIP